jgi:tetratricopeptide (TPR) repeat protein
VVTVFAESRWKAIKAAVAKKERWHPSLLADLHAAYALLQKHPLGTDDQVVWHYEFLVWLGAEWRASGVLRRGIERFVGSPALHKRLRDRVLSRRGPDELEATYASMLEKEPSAQMAAYAGVASVVVAEHYRRTQKLDASMGAYERAIERYEQAIELDPRTQEVADHVIALAHAGRARVAYQRGDDEVALVEILASFKRSPASAGSRDAMGVTPGETGQMLLARLKSFEKSELAAALEAALGKLDPELLRPDRGLLGDGPPR